MKVALVIIPITDDMSTSHGRAGESEEKTHQSQRNRKRNAKYRITAIKSKHLRRLSYGSDRNGKHLSLNLKGLENLVVCMRAVCHSFV